ncbi:MAG: RagB/SusD family nutrient uptake outer membrane protein [Bacteroidota bacterium]
MKNIYTFKSVSTIILLTLCLSCKEFIEIDPPINQVTKDKVYNDEKSAEAAVRGIYASMMANTAFADGGATSVTVLAGRSADDFLNQSNNEQHKQFSDCTLNKDNSVVRINLWQSIYKNIYYANSVLEGLAASSGISESLKTQLSGEAKFIRAFCHFYLTNLFGEIPVILTTDYRINSIAFASSKDQIYSQIIKDLTEAREQLSDNYISSERIRANKYAATALLSRIYLYKQDWKNAESMATIVISNTTNYELLNDLNSVFLKNSKEAILQFVVPAIYSRNTQEGNVFILNSAPSPTTTPVTLSNELISAFDAGDKRLTNWVGKTSVGTSSWFFPFKYKIKTGNSPVNEYSMILRLSEQYLIRAEAKIQQGKTISGINDINVLRTRARSLATIEIPNPLPDLPTTLSEQEALLAVEKERRIELFSEWGHRWFDLKRTNRADVVLTPVKGLNWQHTDILYPIPAIELLNAINLNQNTGYQ